MSPSRHTFADVLLAFRQAKKAIATERGVIGLPHLARFELNLTSSLNHLLHLLQDDSWFDNLEMGSLVVVPKDNTPLNVRKEDIVRIGTTLPTKVHAKVRLQLAPTPAFTIAEILYLWEFGGALESLLGDACLGYRLKRVAAEGAMSRFDRDTTQFII